MNRIKTSEKDESQTHNPKTVSSGCEGKSLANEQPVSNWQANFKHESLILAQDERWRRA